MHGQQNIKICDAKQAKQINRYKNTKIKLYKSNAAIWYSKSCRVKQLIPKAGKSVPLQAWSGPEGSRKLRLPDYVTVAQDGGKVVSLTHRPTLPPGNTPGTDFC